MSCKNFSAAVSASVATTEKPSTVPEIVLQPIKEISGTIKLPGSKSLSNRTLLAALSEAIEAIEPCLFGLQSIGNPVLRHKPLKSQHGTTGNLVRNGGELEAEVVVLRGLFTKAKPEELHSLCTMMSSHWWNANLQALMNYLNEERKTRQK